jgi:hypothetical protein
LGKSRKTRCHQHEITCIGDFTPYLFALLSSLLLSSSLLSFLSSHPSCITISPSHIPASYLFLDAHIFTPCTSLKVNESQTRSPFLVLLSCCSIPRPLLLHSSLLFFIPLLIQYNGAGCCLQESVLLSQSDCYGGRSYRSDCLFLLSMSDFKIEFSALTTRHYAFFRYSDVTKSDRDALATGHILSCLLN